MDQQNINKNVSYPPIGTATSDSHLIAALGACHIFPQVVFSPFFTYFMVCLCHPLDFFDVMYWHSDSESNGVEKSGYIWISFLCEKSSLVRFFLSRASIAILTLYLSTMLVYGTLIICHSLLYFINHIDHITELSVLACAKSNRSRSLITWPVTDRLLLARASISTHAILQVLLNPPVVPAI